MYVLGDMEMIYLNLIVNESIYGKIMTINPCVLLKKYTSET